MKSKSKHCNRFIVSYITSVGKLTTEVISTIKTSSASIHSKLRNRGCTNIKTRKL